MKTRTSKLFAALLLAVSVVCMAFALAACHNKGGGSDIGEQYKSIYEYYKQAAGSNASSLEDWYAEITADIAAADTSEMSDITVIELNSVRNVKVTFANGKIYLQPLVGGDAFHEYAMFVLNAKNAEGNAVPQVSLAICSLNNGEYQVLQTVRTNARGTADAYCEMASAETTYYVQVADASAATYGIARGYEPKLTVVSGTTQVDVTVGTAIKYEITVNDHRPESERTSDYSGMEVSIRYTDAAKQGLVVAKGTTDAQGKLTLTFALHEGSAYEIVVKEGTQPEGYEDVESAAIDLDAKASVLQLYVTRKDGTPKQVEYAQDIEKMPDVPNRDVELIEIGEELGELVKGEDNLYTYDGEPVYVALGYQLDRIYEGKTIKQVIEANDTKDYFSYETRTDDATNTWTKFLFHDMLAEYIKNADNHGLYRLNEDLYNFIQKAQEYHLFAGAEETKDELEILLPLVKYGEAWLMPDGPQVDVKAPAVSYKYAEGDDIESNSVMVIPVNGAEAGYYKLTLSNVRLNGTYGHFDYSSCIYYGYTVGDYIIKDTEAFPNEHYRHYFVLEYKGANLFEGYVYLPEGCNSINIAIAPAGAGEALANLVDGATFNLQLTQVNEDWTSAAPVVMRVDDNLEESGEQEYEVLAVPASWNLRSTKKAWGKYSTYATGYAASYTTLGALIAPERGYETYTISISADDMAEVTSLKVAQFQLIIDDSDYRSGRMRELGSATTFSSTASKTITAMQSAKYLDLGASYAYGLVFTHSGDAPVKIKVKFTAKWNGYRVHYSAGEGQGKDYIDNDSFRASMYYVLDPSALELNYKKEGYTFVGWKYTDPEEQEHTVQPGDSLNFHVSNPDKITYNVFLKAQWKENAPYTAKDELKLGESGKIDVALDGSKYTETEVKLASEVTEGYYKLTVDLGANTKDGLIFTAGDNVSALILDSEASDDSNHIYTTYFYVGADTKSIHFPTPTSDFAAVTASLKLEKIAELTVNDDKEETKEIPVNGWYSDSESTLFKAKLADGIVAGSYYISVERTEGYEITVYTENATLELGTKAEGYIDIPEGDKNIWLVGSSRGFAQNILATISLHRVYTITYEPGSDEVTGTMSKQYFEGDTDVKIQNNTFVRKNYNFVGWIYYEGEEAQVYNPASDENFHMPKKDLVFTAKWKATQPLKVALSNRPTEVLIDSEVYTAFQLTAGGTQFYFDNMTKNSFMIFAELGDTDFNGTLQFSTDSTPTETSRADLNFMYSEKLSTPTNKVYAAYYAPAKQAMGTRTFTMKNFDKELAGRSINAKFSYIRVANVSEDRKTGKYTVYTYYGNSGNTTEPMDARYAPTGEQGSAFALFPSGYYDHANLNNMQTIRNTLNTGLLAGNEYTLHIKTNGFKVQGLANALDRNRTFTAKSDGYEWTTDVTAGTDDKFILTYTSLRFDDEEKDIAMNYSTPVYIADVWLEAKGTGSVLSEETPVTFKVSKDSSATVTLSGNVISKTDYILKATFKGDKKADLSVAAASTISLTEDNGYRNKHVQFSAKTLQITTESADELEVTLSIKKFAPTEITDVQADQYNNRYELPADKQDIDLIPSSNLTNTAKKATFKVQLDLSEVDAAIKDKVVVKLRSGDNTYEFNGNNNWTLENVSFSGNYYEIWSENGSAIVTVWMEQLILIKYNTDSAKFEMSDKNNTHDIWIDSSSIPTDGNNMYSMTLIFNKADGVDPTTAFTLTYDNDKSVPFVYVSDNSSTYTCEAVFIPTVANAEKFVVNYSGNVAISNVYVRVINDYDLNLSYSKNERTTEFKGNSGKDKYFVSYDTSNTGKNQWIKFYAYVPLDEGRVDDTKDFSKLTITFNGIKSGEPFTVNGFTKGEDGKYFTEMLINCAEKKGTFTISGIDDTMTWTLGYILSESMEKIKLGTTTLLNYNTRFYEPSRANSYSEFSERYFTLDEGFDASKEYMFVLTESSKYPTSPKTAHDLDDVVYTIFQGVEGAPVKLNKANDYTAAVKFTSADAVIGISFEGCKFNQGNYAVYHVPKFFTYPAEYVEQRDIEVDGDEVTFHLLGGTKVPFKITNHTQNAVYTVDIKQKDGSELSNGYYYPILTVGEIPYKFNHIFTQTIQFTSDTFTLEYYGTSADDEIVIKLTKPTASLKVDDTGVDIDFKKSSMVFNPEFNFLFGEGFDFNKTYDVTVRDTSQLTISSLNTILKFTTGTKSVTFNYNCLKDGENTFVFRGVKFEEAVLLGIELNSSNYDRKINITLAEHAEPPKVTGAEGVDVVVDANANDSNNLNIVLEPATTEGKLYDIVLKLQNSTLAEGETAKLTLGTFGAVTAAYGDAADTEYVIYGRTITADTKTVLLTAEANKQLTWTISLREHKDIKLKMGEALSLTVPKGVSSDQHFTISIDDSVANAKLYDIKLKLITELVEGDSVTLQVDTGTVTAKYADESKEYTIECIIIGEAKRALEITTTAKKELTWSVTLTEHENPNPKIKLDSATEFTIKASLAAGDNYYIEVDSSVSLDETYDIVATLKDKSTALPSNSSAQLNFGSLGYVKARSSDNITNGTYYIYGVKFTDVSKIIQLTTTASKELTWEISLRKHTPLPEIKLNTQYTVMVPAYPDSGNNFRIPLSSEFNTNKKYDITLLATTVSSTIYFYIASGKKTSPQMLNFSTRVKSASWNNQTLEDFLYFYIYNETYTNKTPFEFKITIKEHT